MSTSAQNSKLTSHHRGKNRQKSNYDSGPIWKRFAYGGGTLLITVGPVLAGMNAMKWMTIYMGINTTIVMVACLAGIWKSLTRTTQSSRQRR